MNSNYNLLLLSSSRVGKTEYLAHAKDLIKSHLNGIDEILFIPFAGVTISYDQYTQMVQDALADLSIKVVGIHQTEQMQQAVQNAKAIVIGGGNTFHLLYQLYQNGLIELIQQQCNNGTPYIGWSAGSNVAGLTIKTTNDMPIIQPPSFDALALLPYQLNPHYTDYTPPGHNGETREQRLQEFMVVNNSPILGIVEGTGLQLSKGKLRLVSSDPAQLNQGFLFTNGEKQSFDLTTDLNQLLA